MAQPVDTIIRWHQQEDQALGPIFTALYTFAERTVDTFFYDTPELPQPILKLEICGGRRGSYQPMDGGLLPHIITIDPYRCEDGADAAEVMVHELVHLWQHYVGRLPGRNYHNAEFHQRLGLCGILSSGKAGHHDGYVEGGVWHDWLGQCNDLELSSFLLPGAKQEISE